MGVSEVGEDLQAALEDEGEAEAADEVEEENPYSIVLESLKRRTSKQILDFDIRLLNLQLNYP